MVLNHLSIVLAQENPWWAQLVTNPLYMVTFLAVLFYVMVWIPERRNRAKQEQRLSELKKNDRIVSIGGIHGTIVGTSDDNFVVVRIDENSNTRIHLNRSAVAKVIGEDSES